ncbi:hypothetical protein J6590_023796 [Homalodisca vitripennis]|nr:hypothetical protein J6590_023796 [Homalodisca vitripennis]
MTFARKETLLSNNSELQFSFIIKCQNCPYGTEPGVTELSQARGAAGDGIRPSDVTTFGVNPLFGIE